MKFSSYESNNFFFMGVLFTFVLLVLPLSPSMADDTVTEMSKDELMNKINELRQDLAEREKIIQRLENEGNITRPVYPTVERLRGTVTELNKTITNLQDRLDKYKNRNLQELQEARQQAQQRAKRLNELQSELKDVKEAQTTRKQGQMTVTLDDAILFKLGEASLKESARPTLNELSKIISDYDGYRVLIQGHTDDIPVSGDQFESNWELSAQRAVNVVEYLQSHSSLPGDRLVAAGYGPYHPVVPNTSPENRAKNRRVEIKLVPIRALKAEETLNSDSETTQ